MVEQNAGEDGRQNVHKIIAEEDCAKQPLTVADQIVNRPGAPVAVGFELMQARPGSGGQRRLRAREKP